MPNCPWREPYFSPPFCHISPPTDLICVIFIWIIHIFIKTLLQQNWCKTEQYLARYPNLAQFPQIKSAKGCQNGGTSTLTKYIFQTPGWLSIIKEVLLSCFGMKEGPGWGVVACNVGTQCQNLNCISVQTTGVVLFAPNFMNHLVISLNMICIKKVTFQDICSVDPLW